MPPCMVSTCGHDMPGTDPVHVGGCVMVVEGVSTLLDPRLTCVKAAGALLLHVMAVVVSLVAAHPA
jgi:hypothetical protein